MNNKFKHCLVVSATVGLGLFSLNAFASGGPSGAHVDFGAAGKLGEIIVDPYGIAPLTAVIRNGGYVLRDATVTVLPKPNGQKISYKVSNAKLLTHGGLPVFGLYPDYNNKVEVTYTRVNGQKSEKITETYTIYAAPVHFEPYANGKPQNNVLFDVAVKTVAPEFSDRLYFINNLVKNPKAARMVWNNPAGGALEWNFMTRNAIIDTHGEVRWYLNSEAMQTPSDIYRSGIMMGFHQNQDGALSWGFGQRYVKYDLLGREIFNRRLPMNYNDYSHDMDPSPNGNYFLRVASSDLKRADGKHVRTVRDVIAEITPTGEVRDEWRLFDILDPYRDINIKVLDQGAVCLNVDASKAGQTISAEDLAELDKDDKFGDIVGTGAGRNWAHVNSVDHDASDDSIIISSRHQSAAIKIGRDKKVKWILGSHEGWKKEFQNKLLTPVDARGRKIACDGSKCEGGFDWTWTQHTAWKIDTKSKGDIVYLSVFDNGDTRGMEQPAIASMKYSRAVIFKIDQKKMTVQQVWEYGKERGNTWYSPITSLVEYQKDKNSVFVYSATAGSAYDPKSGGLVGAPSPYLNEFKWGASEPSVEIQLKKTMGYRAMPISVDRAFAQ